MTGSTRFGSIAANTHVFTGSMSVSGSGTFASSITATNGNFSVESSATNSVLDILTLTHTTSGTAASGLGAGILFRAERPSSGITLSRGAIYGVSGTDADDDGDLAFYTLRDTGAGGFNEKMRITSAGNVGIGTSAPKTNLQISNVSGADLLSLGISDYQAWVGGKIDLQGISSFGADMAFYTHPANSSNNATVVERMRIKSDGEVTFSNSISLSSNQRVKLSGGAGNLTGSGQTTISSTIATIFSGFTLGGVTTGNLVIVMGVKSGTGWNFSDLVLYMGSGTISVISSTTLGSPPARTYTVSGNDLRLSIAGGDTGFVACTALTQGYQA